MAFSDLVISAGMQRSGSTLLFNILKQLFGLRSPTTITAGYIRDYAQLGAADLFIIKTHTLPVLLRLRARQIFYTYRDVRTAMVSQNRKFGGKPDLGFVSYCINQYLIAKRYGTLLIKYEDLIEDPLIWIERIAGCLKMQVDAGWVWEHVNNTEIPKSGDGYSKETLFHPNHATGTTDGEWRAVLEQNLQNEICDRFGWWLDECNYPRT
ncbi:hypothetical protein V3330_04620 [Wenzhouxiangellaceae bacterium CH-27]|uniref:Sulfotransferase domain-containing protein n=1 Tax=Elongatibacter sediminis TaxID=3119006 RepID=A0AAW9RFQ6_9GAMM